MKVLIQDARSGDYLGQNGAWTPLPSHGRDFRFSSCAQSVLRREKLSNLRVLYYFEDFDYCIQVRRPGGRMASHEFTAAAFDF
ncbi:MAG: hypothetical protein JWQ04_1339 [Pedosphaera sp.]|nr:hypothetical protein [Pedosphaera sp.]